MSDNKTKTDDYKKQSYFQDELLGWGKEETIKGIKQILWKHLDRKKYKAFVFGSFAQGNFRRSSDIDLGIKGKNEIPAHLLVEIEDDLEESDIPYVIEVVDFMVVNKEFAKNAMQTTIGLN